MIHKHEHGERSVASRIADSTELWWSERKPDERSLWESKVELGEKFFQEIIAHPIPLDLHTLKGLKRSPLGLDLYFWLTYRTFALKTPLRLSWRQVYRQFGVDPARAGDARTVDNFRTDLSARVEENQDGLASPALPDGEGGIGALALAVAHPPVATAARGIAAAGRHKRPSCQHAGMRRLRA